MLFPVLLAAMSIELIIAFACFIKDTCSSGNVLLTRPYLILEQLEPGQIYGHDFVGDIISFIFP